MSSASFKILLLRHQALSGFLANQKDAARLIWLLPVLLLSIYQLYCSPWVASALDIVPDSVEYAIGAHRLATLGHFDIAMNGMTYPSRYLPWFSTMLAPLYWLFPGEIGLGILPVLACALAAVIVVYLLGDRLAGPPGAIAGAAVLIWLNEFSFYSKRIMTDVPAASLGLVSCWLFVKMSSSGSSTLSNLAWAGILIALASSFRPLELSLLLPFMALCIQHKNSRFSKLLVLILPSLFVFVGSAIYEQNTFGDWKRTGYQFWCPVPYDYQQLVFSWQYLKPNLAALANQRIAIIMALAIPGTILLFKQNRDALSPILKFLLLGAMPISAIHLFYFFPDLRFHILSLCLLCLLGCSGVAALFSYHLKHWSFSAAILILATLILPQRDDPIPIRRIGAEEIARTTPDNAVILSSTDPLFLEFFVVSGTKRRILPLSRNVEYASKAVATGRVANPVPFPQNWNDHRCSGLRDSGARDVYPFTAEEAMPTIAQWIRQGIPVYIDCSQSSNQEHNLWSSSFSLQPVTKLSWLMHMHLKPGIRL